MIGSVPRVRLVSRRQQISTRAASTLQPRLTRVQKYTGTKPVSSAVMITSVTYQTPCSLRMMRNMPDW